MDFNCKKLNNLSDSMRDTSLLAQEFEKNGLKIHWENVGDPISKGEKIPIQIMKLIKDYSNSTQLGYTSTKGFLETRKYLANKITKQTNKKFNPENIIFFNGVSEAFAKIYSAMHKDLRVIVPTPVYPAHSTEEYIHSGKKHFFYNLDINNNWEIDFNDLENQVKNNKEIIAILIISPNNPTGKIYDEKTLKKLVEIAKKYKLFLISDEIYSDLVFNNSKFTSLNKVIKDTPCFILRGISKNVPWPGARCGWLEYYNQGKNNSVDALFNSILKLKSLEICSTFHPQLLLPQILEIPELEKSLKKRNSILEKKANYAYETLSQIPQIIINKPESSFYLTIVFKKGVLKKDSKLKIENKKFSKLLEKELNSKFSLDKRFAYYLLASTGICITPLSSFYSKHPGFRMTILEKDFDQFKWLINIIKEKIEEYIKN